MKTKAKKTPLQIATRKLKRWIYNNIEEVVNKILYYTIIFLAVITFAIFSYFIISFILLFFAYPFA